MAGTDGAKIIPGPGSGVLSARDEDIIYERSRGVPAKDVAAKHGISVQRVYNVMTENRDRIAQIQQAELETMRVLRHEKFSDLFIMKEAPVMAGYNHIAQTALRRFMELDAASHVYDSETDQWVATRTKPSDVAAMKSFADMYNQAIMSAHELRGRRPGRLSDKNSNRWVMLKHTDPPPPEVLEARRKAREAEEAAAQRQAEAERSALMQRLMAANPVMQQQLWSSMEADPRYAEIERRIEERYADEADGEDDGEDDGPEPEPEPVTVPEPSPFVASVASAMRGTLALGFDPETLEELEISKLAG